MGAVRPKSRFEVFKRDDFQCQYCGRRVPDVTLEVDHIIAVADGGSNRIDNLVTSCWECNRGKGAKAVGDGVPTVDYEERAALATERRKQMRIYLDYEEEIEADVQAKITTALQYWAQIGDRDQVYDPRSMRRFVRMLGLVRLKDAMDVAAGRTDLTPERRWRFLCGVLWKMIRGEGPHADGAG